MKLKTLALFLVFALLLPVAAQAATPRATSCYPDLSFSGSTATCSVRILTGTTTDEIEATITLLTGKTIIEVWTVSANGHLNFSDTATVEYGKTYILTVTYWINGEKQTPVSTSNTP